MSIVGVSDQFSLTALMRVVHERRRVAIWVGGTGILLSLAFAGLSPTRYTAEATFLPQSGSDAAQIGLKAIAGQFGLNVGGASQAQSPDLYADLLTSPALLRTVAASRYSSGTAVASLADLFHVDNDVAEEVRVELAVRELRDRLSVTVSRKTGAVAVRVVTPWRAVSVALVDSLLVAVNDFNIKSRRTQAGEERRFAEARLSEARASLRDGENQLSGFLEQNRQFASSPNLSFQHDRLEREVAVRQQLVVTLTQALEEARLREVRDTPVISVLSPPGASLLPDPKNRILKVVVGAALSALLGISAALAVGAAGEGSFRRSDRGRELGAK